MTDKSSSVIIETLDAKKLKIGVMTLNAEKTLNSLNLEMVRIISAQLKTWASDDSISVVILKGAGKKAFCAGGDVQQLYQSAIQTPGGPCDYAESFFLEEYRLNYQIHRYQKPVICLGSGIVMGGGLGLMAGASHRVASDTTRISMPEITIGLFPDVGGTWFLNKMPRGLGIFFALSGASINANDALYTGLADVVVPAKQQEDLIPKLLEQSWSHSIDENHTLATSVLNALAMSTHTLNQEFPSEVQAHLNFLENACQQTSLGEIKAALLAPPAQDQDSKWITRALSTMESGSPLSSLIIFEQLKRYRYASLELVFESELSLATNCVRHPEFAEGVRALLIDKDNNPQWKYAHFSEIPSSLFDQFFAAPWPVNPFTESLNERSQETVECS